MPFLRSDAPSRENTPYLPSSVVITSLTMRALVIIESTIFGFVTSVMSIAYTRSAIVDRYAHVPEGWTHTSAVLIVIGTRPRTSRPRPTSRALTLTTASASFPPIDAVTVYFPGSSATNAPLGSISATPEPAATPQSTATSPSARPAALRAVAENFTTSPARTVDVDGSTATRATVLGTTCTASASVAGPAAAVIVARPAASARTRPSLVTLMMRGFDDVNVTGSERRSP